jgi:release factor glutamine methyltransferase
MTIAEARRALADAFRKAGLDSPELDARLLVGHALGLDHARLTASPERALSATDESSISALKRRRLAREPIAHILGMRAVWGLMLGVTPATLVPRPETETIVEIALAVIDEGGPRSRALRIADLGTGTGALLLALLSELPNAFGIGTDMSAEALAVARGNAEQVGLTSRARFVRCDFGSALAGGFDLVVSNPPYIPSGDIAALSPEVQRDPRSALDGGVDGLACYRMIAADAKRLIAPAGNLVVELGIGQEPAVADLVKKAGLFPLPAKADLSGIPRALRARLATIGL